MNYSFDTRHAIIMSSRSGPTLGKFSLDHFSICRRQWPQVLLHQCNLECIFNNLQFDSQSLAGFWIPKEKNSLIPGSGFPYMGRDSTWKQDMS